jgi:hypothetical protein
MRRIIMIAALAAIAILATAAVATATVAVDANGTGFVGKGDVQTALGWNNAAFDANAGSVEFTQKTVTSAHYALVCNGTDYVDDMTVTTTKPVTATAIKNAGNGRQITGWNLTGVGTGTPVTTHTDPNARSQWLSCVIGGGDAAGSVSSSNTTLPGLYVNGISLPNTPVALPAA